MLTKEQISEGNELIARFRGGKKKLIFSHTPVWEFPDGTTYRHAFLKYHNSWSKLMPVVEQICKTKMGDGVKFIDYHYLQTFGMKNEESGEFMVRFLGCSLFQSKDLIEATYLAVVDFIKHIKS